MSRTTDIDYEQVLADFAEAANMSPSELEKWLRTEESLDNGWKADGRRSLSVITPDDVSSISSTRRGQI